MSIACSSDLDIGDVSNIDQPVEAAPSDEIVSAQPDARISPRLAPPDVTINHTTEDVFGWPVTARIGDMDGDGFGDFAVRSADQVTGVEYVHVRYGGPRPASARDAFALAESGARPVADVPGEPQIELLVPAGDVNGDGLSDLLVGVGRCWPTVAGEGAYLVYGDAERLSGATRLAQAGVYLRSPRPIITGQPDQGVGCGATTTPYVAGLGDFDGDGFDDFILSDPQSEDFANLDDPDASPSSAAYLFYGRTEKLPSETSWLDADARLVARQDLVVSSPGDVNADGLGDLIIGSSSSLALTLPSDNFWLAGRTERFQGHVELRSVGIALTGADPDLQAENGPADIDGDGIPDLFLTDGNATTHLFYGAPGLLDAGVDFTSSAAHFTRDVGGHAPSVFVAGDRDADGDADLMTIFPTGEYAFQAYDLTFVSGSKQRFSGAVPFAVQATLDQNPMGYFFEDSRYLDDAANVGDLDGDGATDLVTISAWRDPGDGSDGLFPFQPRLHIHYGTPGGELVPVPR